MAARCSLLKIWCYNRAQKVTTKKGDHTKANISNNILLNQIDYTKSKASLNEHNQTKTVLALPQHNKKHDNLI